MTLKLGSIENLNEIYIIHMYIFQLQLGTIFLHNTAPARRIKYPADRSSTFFSKSEHCVKPVCKQNSDKGELT